MLDIKITNAKTRNTGKELAVIFPSWKPEIKI